MTLANGRRCFCYCCYEVLMNESLINKNQVSAYFWEVFSTYRSFKCGFFVSQSQSKQNHAKSNETIAKFWRSTAFSFKGDDNFSKSIRLHLIYTARKRNKHRITRNRPLGPIQVQNIWCLIWIMWSHVIIALIWNNIYMRVNAIFFLCTLDQNRVPNIGWMNKNQMIIL